MMNGFKTLYEELFCGSGRILFEIMVKDGKTAVTAEEFTDAVDHIAGHLSPLLTQDQSPLTMRDQSPQSAGDQRETRPFVGVRIRNSWLLYAVAFGVLKAGGNLVLLDAKSCAENIGQLLREVRGSLLITDSGAAPAADGIRNIDAAELLEPWEGPQAESWEGLMAFATSGTTGKSKIIAYGGEEIYRQVSRTAGWFQETPHIARLLGDSQAERERVVSILPMHHIFGFLCPLILLRYGFRILFPKNDAISTILSTIKGERVWGCLSVPMFWQTVVNILSRRCGQFDREAVQSVLGDHFTFCLTGGTYADKKLRGQFLDAGLAFTLGFGMTETGCCTMHFMDQSTLDSEGCLYRWYDAVIRDTEGNLAENGTGELLLKSDVLFKGYIKDGELLPREDEGGYYPTGDIFRKAGGSITFVGRCKNVIVNESGENIYIEELEQRFSALARYGVLYGIADVENEPLLVVKLGPDAPVDRICETVTEIVNGLPVYQRPYKAVLTKGDVPLTAKGELRRTAVTEALFDHGAAAELVFKSRK